MVVSFTHPEHWHLYRSKAQEEKKKKRVPHPSLCGWGTHRVMMEGGGLNKIYIYVYRKKKNLSGKQRRK